MKGTFGQLRSSRQQEPTLLYARLAAQYKLAFLRLFAPEIAREFEEASTGGVAMNSLTALYAGLNYADFEAGIYAFAQAAKPALPALVKNWTYSFLGTAFTKANRDAAVALFATCVPSFSKTGSRTQWWLAANFEASEGTPLLQLEPMLCALYWAFENPAAFELRRQQFLLLGLNTLWNLLPQAEQARFRAAGWLIPTVVGANALNSGDMAKVLTQSAAIWQNLQVSP